MADSYRAGDNYLIDDETGLKIRASEAVKRWDGSVVHRSVTNPRHPQDFVRVKPDHQAAAVIRSRTPETFIGPLKTVIIENAAVKSELLKVESSVRMLADDVITIMLDNTETFRTKIVEVPDTEHIRILPVLPSPASAGAEVVNYTATSTPEL